MRVGEEFGEGEVGGDAVLEEVGRGRGGDFAVGGGVYVAVGEEDAVLMVAADAGGIVEEEEGEDFG